MLDNNIDNLFKASLEEYEVKPSSGSWRKINFQLEGKRQNKSQTTWLAAASIILAIGFGFKLFENEQEIIRLTGNGKAAPLLEEALPVKLKVVEPITKELSLAEVKKANEKHFLSILEKSSTSLIRREKIKEEAAIAESNTISSYVAVTTNKEIRKEASEKPDDLKLDLNTNNEDPIFADVHHNKNTFAPKEAIHSAERSVIKSVGNFVNFVIAKVDNRERKLLQISSTEESDMEITQINLGLIKYKKN